MSVILPTVEGAGVMYDTMLDAFMHAALLYVCPHARATAMTFDVDVVAADMLH